MNELDPRVGRYLHRQAATLDLPPASMDRVARRARQRRNRRRGVAALAVLSLGVVGVDQLSTSTPSGTVVAGSGGGSLGVGPALDWRRQDPAGADTALGYASSWARDASGAIYALSTEPGRVGTRTARQAVYRSVDGIDWQAASVLTPRLYLSDLDAGLDGRIYALGTSAASASVGESIFVGVSADAGATWDHLDLPVDLAAVRAVSEALAVPATSVVAGPQATVAVVGVQARLDAAALGLRAPHGLRVSAAGVGVLGAPTDADLASDEMCSAGTVRRLGDDDRRALAGGRERAERARAAAGVPATAEAPAPQAATPPPGDAGGPDDAELVYGCEIPGSGVRPIPTSAVHGRVTSTHSWAELGVGDDVRLAALGAVRAFVSADGGPFTEVSLPEGATAGPGPAHVVATSQGFALLSASWDHRGGGAGGGVALATSTDGVSWAAGTGPQAAGVLSGAGRLGPELAVVGDGGGTGAPTLSLSADGVAWRDVALAAALDPAAGVEGPLHVQSAAFGPAGVAVVLWEQDGRDGRELLLTSPDGATWTTTELDGLAVAPEGDHWTRSVAVSDTDVVVHLDVPVDGAPMGTAVLAAPLR